MMSTCEMNETKLEVCENVEEAEVEMSDVDDDVFVRGGRNGFRLEIYDAAKKPLMAPRKKQTLNGIDKVKNGGFHTDVRSSSSSLRLLCMPICYIIIAVLSMLGIIGLIAFISHYVTIPLSFISFFNKLTLRSTFNSTATRTIILPCDSYKVEDVWVRNFPKLLTESAFRMLDVNQDGIDDVIFGFATGADGYEVPNIVCDIYFNGQNPCFGGVLALDGKDGSEIWRHWATHEVFAINCNEDLNADGAPDCLVAGRAGVFSALNSKTGVPLWNFADGAAKEPLMNIYTPQFIRDVNGDGILDVLAIHGGDPLASPRSESRLSGRILILSGKNGDVLSWSFTPDKSESYYSPQIITKSDGLDYVLFGTGGETHSGGLFIISIPDLYKGLINNAKMIYGDKDKGVIATPVLTDINQDGVDDIIIPMFNSTLIAFDGNSFEQIWNVSFPSSETYTTPTPGYFNEDNIPDFLVKYQTGPGFPIYYSAQTTIIDGKTGESLLNEPIVESIGSQSSTPSIRVQGYGNDIFIYWSSNCKGFEGNSTQFSFIKGTNVHEQSRSNLCKLRFDSSLINQLHAFNRATNLPGALIYDSDERRESEYEGAVNTSLEGQLYLSSHPIHNYQYSPGAENENIDLNLGNEKDYGLLNSFDPNNERNKEGIETQYPHFSYGSPHKFSKFPESESEIEENIQYPSIQHSVRKHGSRTQNREELSSPINIKRTGQHEINRGLPPVNEYGYEDDMNRDKLRLFPQQWVKEGNSNNGYDYDYLSPPHLISKRHIGPHDSNGIQRLISTGTLGRPLKNSSDESGIDIIFATYWFYPAKTQIILPSHKNCIEERMLNEGQRFEQSNQYYGLSHEEYEEVVTKECIRINRNNGENEETFETQRSYNPYDIHMGQMTVYRLHLTCSCSEAQIKKNSKNIEARCGKILPFEDQTWTGYMGSSADSYFPPKKTTFP